MKRSLTLLFLCLWATALLATNATTFVRSDGRDSRTCSRTAPCQSFAYAITQTSPGGQIIALDTADYGAVIIDKSISIYAEPGATAMISAGPGAGNSPADDITIVAAVTDVVILRNLALTTTGAHNGVYVSQVGTLYVDHCNFVGSGTWVGLNTPVGLNAPVSTAGPMHIAVSDSSFTGGLGGAQFAGSPNGDCWATVDHCTFVGGGAGVIGTDLSHVVVTNSSISGAWGAGIIATAEGGNPVDVTVEACRIQHGNAGIVASFPGAAVRVANSTIVDNVAGIAETGGIVVGETVGGNGTNVVSGNTFSNSMPGHFPSQ